MNERCIFLYFSEKALRDDVVEAQQEGWRVKYLESVDLENLERQYPGDLGPTLYCGPRRGVLLFAPLELIWAVTDGNYRTLPQRDVQENFRGEGWTIYEDVHPFELLQRPSPFSREYVAEATFSDRRDPDQEDLMYARLETYVLSQDPRRDGVILQGEERDRHDYRPEGLFQKGWQNRIQLEREGWEMVPFDDIQNIPAYLKAMKRKKWIQEVRTFDLGGEEQFVGYVRKSKQKRKKKVRRPSLSFQS